ncbi:MAG: hypothetical protein ACI9HK_005556 [Pirellulaceae bacterium]|jgi:hypothetical protein
MKLSGSWVAHLMQLRCRAFISVVDTTRTEEAGLASISKSFQINVLFAKDPTLLALVITVIRRISLHLLARPCSFGLSLQVK